MLCYFICGLSQDIDPICFSCNSNWLFQGNILYIQNFFSIKQGNKMEYCWRWCYSIVPTWNAYQENLCTFPKWLSIWVAYNMSMCMMLFRKNIFITFWLLMKMILKIAKIWTNLSKKNLMETRMNKIMI